MRSMWNEMTRDELSDVLPRAVVVLPTGATEQHGPYLATGHDTFTVTTVAERAADATTVPVVVAPTLAFGSSHHHLAFGGTLSLTTETYSRVVSDLVRSMIQGGARRIFLLNGHGGNQELNVLAARDVAMQQPGDAPVAIAAASYWQVAASSLRTLPGLEGVPSPGHAGTFETSTMLATNPERVREPRQPRSADAGVVPALVGFPGVRLETTGSWQTFEGYTDDPIQATPELGVAVLDAVVRDVATAFDALAAHPLL